MFHLSDAARLRTCSCRSGAVWNPCLHVLLCCRAWVEQQRPAALDAEYAKTGVKGRFLGVWGKKPYFLVHTDTGEEAMTANNFERHAGGLPRLQQLLLGVWHSGRAGARL